MISNKYDIHPDEIIKICKQHGLEVNQNQAEFILDFISILAEVAFNQEKYENSGTVHQGKHGRTGRQRILPPASGRVT
ncbi:hypothetical protein MM213_12455 [Belliella sp. R4-6]|uniref:Uncharacterized protein n=1 Tax=Belliella alkalica TaxID=1730871 RepID=A0ABS9VCY6_9BACT|nr:hypothetical protein [Belliella alkalica]MCH7414302.1 hypothetical protein [Belliella alkalica]